MSRFTATDALNLSPGSLAHLERPGIVAEITSRQCGRVFSYRR